MHENADAGRDSIYREHMRRIVLALAVAATGCSLTLQNKPARGPAVSAEGCSTTKLWWVADAVMVAAGLAAVGYGITGYGVSDRTSDATASVGSAGALASVLFAASMGNGIRWSRQCREQQQSAVESNRTATAR